MVKIKISHPCLSPHLYDVTTMTACRRPRTSQRSSAFCHCIAGTTSSARIQTSPVCSATNRPVGVSRRTALRSLSALLLSLSVCSPASAANDVIKQEEDLILAPELRWRRRLAEDPSSNPDLPPEENNRRRFRFGNEEDESIEKFHPDWEVGDGLSLGEHFRIFSARASFVLFVTGFTLFGRAISDRESGRVQLPERYDPAAVAKYFALRPDRIVARLLQLGFEGSKLALLGFQHSLDALWNDGALTPGARALRAASRREERASALRGAVSRLGPAFVKLAQAAAMRPDVVGAELARQLQAMQESIVDPFPVVDAVEMMRDELEASPQAIFDSLDTNPIAGASLGMVFRGVVDGAPVAVKVQNPKAAESIALDVYLVRTIVGAAIRFLGWRYELRGVVDEFGARLFEELDYRNEVNNMLKFCRVYSDAQGVVIPKPYAMYSSKKVLVAEFVHGTKIDTCKVSKREMGVVETGIEFALTQLLDRGLLHADMHSGNLLCTEKGEIALIDFGIVCEIPPRVREAIVLVLFYLMLGEYELLAEACVSLALYGSDVDDDLVLFAGALADEFSDMESGASSPVVGKFTLIGVAEKLLHLGGRFPFVFNSYFVNALRCLALLEGLALNADPDFSVLNVVYPCVMRKILAGERESAYRTALLRVIQDKDGVVRWNKLESMLNEVRRAESVSGVSTTIRRLPDGRPPLDDLLLSSRGAFLRRQMMKEWQLPRAANVFRRASVQGKVRAMCVFLPALILRAIVVTFLFVKNLIARLLRLYSRRSNQNNPRN